MQIGTDRIRQFKNEHYKDLLNAEGKIKPEYSKIPLNFGYIFANYKPGSDILRQQIESIPKSEDFLYIESSFMGYGLYSNMIKHRDDLEETLKIKR